MMHAVQRDPLALYVHWPFCVSKCPYCDFNSHVRDSVDHDAWRAALLADLAHEAGLTNGREVTSIFFGGGTPSLMRPQTVAAIIEAADAAWGLTEDVEITLEANPSSVEVARFVDIAAAGVNRVSLGLQSLDDQALAFLGRAHDARDGLAALEIAQRAFDRVSADFIYALPGQSAAAWERQLAEVLGFGTGHLSLYQLTIEPGTRFATLAARGDIEPLDPDVAADLFDLTQDLTAAEGLPAYEISNHARPGDQSRHNLAYWRYQNYAGIGPGAHGRRDGRRTQRHRKPENWLASVAASTHGIVEEAELEPLERSREALLMGLRLQAGVDLGRLSELTGLTVGEMIDGAAVADLIEHDLIRRSGAWLQVTREGMPVLDAILGRIVV